jgi:glycosyltransferase involved in cell wall biosynthesis
MTPAAARGKEDHMSELPIVSIITPAYNRASFLEETIESVLAQDYPRLQYIVLNDGSTDNTEEILRRYTGRLHWESHPNMGETGTVNKGFSMAKGEIIGVVNSDDPLLPGAISTIAAAMAARPDAIVAYPDWDMIDAEGGKIEHIQTYDYDYVNMIRWHHCVPGPGTLIRKWVIEKLSGRDPQFRYVGDFDFWLRAGLLGPFLRVPQTLATFRWHSDGASSKDQGVVMAEEHTRLVRKIFSIRKLPRPVSAVKREAFSSAYYIAGVTLGNSSPALQKKYFRRALVLSPLKYAFEYRTRFLNLIAPCLFGPRTLAALRKLDARFPHKNSR